jgi:hypothetical protein
MFQDLPGSIQKICHEERIAIPELFVSQIRSRDLTVAPRSVGRMKGQRAAVVLQLSIRIHDNKVVDP